MSGVACVIVDIFAVNTNLVAVLGNGDFSCGNIITGNTLMGRIALVKEIVLAVNINVVAFAYGQYVVNCDTVVVNTCENVAYFLCGKAFYQFDILSLFLFGTINQTAYNLVNVGEDNSAVVAVLSALEIKVAPQGVLKGCKHLREGVGNGGQKLIYVQSGSAFFVCKL